MNRTKSLSINSIKIYKAILIAIYASAVVAYLVFLGFEKTWLSVMLVAGQIPTFIIAYPRLRKLMATIKEVEYDKENLYVKEDNYEIQIPFFQVKDIEIVSLDGLYQFNLYHHDQFGKEVICKPSLWYPLNFKKIDKELNRIRSLVRKAHREYKQQDNLTNRLASIN